MTPNTHIHDCSLSWPGTGTSIKSGGVNLLLWAHSIKQLPFILTELETSWSYGS